MSISCIHLVKIIRGIILPEQQRNSATAQHATSWKIKLRMKKCDLYFILLYIIYIIYNNIKFNLQHPGHVDNSKCCAVALLRCCANKVVNIPYIQHALKNVLQ